ncbi:hypothetical protein APSETT444_004715 [Aspergillus pseudonomiae]
MRVLVIIATLLTLAYAGPALEERQQGVGCKHRRKEFRSALRAIRDAISPRGTKQIGLREANEARIRLHSMSLEDKTSRITPISLPHPRRSSHPRTNKNIHVTVKSSTTIGM